MPTEDAYFSGHLVLSLFGTSICSTCWDQRHPVSITHYTNLWHYTGLYYYWICHLTKYWFPLSICNGCGMPTGDAYSSGHLVLSHFWTCKCSNVETNLSWTCLVSGLLSFEHPSVLLFFFFFALRRILFCVLIKITSFRWKNHRCRLCLHVPQGNNVMFLMIYMGSCLHVPQGYFVRLFRCFTSVHAYTPHNVILRLVRWFTSVHAYTYHKGIMLGCFDGLHWFILTRTTR